MEINNRERQEPLPIERTIVPLPLNDLPPAQHRLLRMDLELIQRRLPIFPDRQRHPRRRLQVTVLQVFCLPLESKD